MKNVLIAMTQAPAEKEQRIFPDDFETVVREHQRRIYRILFLLLRDPDAADALTQECFLRAYSRRSGFRGEAGLGTWLIRIAINLAQDELKSRRSTFWRCLLRGKEREAESLADRRHTPEDEILERERVAAIWTVVGNLPLQQRMVFTLRFAEEMPLAEIAHVMKIREGTVKAHLSYAIQAIRRALGQVPGTPAR